MASPAPYAGQGLTGSQRDAFTALTDLFNSYGLGTLAPVIAGYVKDGYSADTVSILLQNTPQYKQRFAGNDARIKAGLAPLSPAEYLATERAYHQTLQKYGLPAGFYDQPSDFTQFIANDVSPTELDQRAKEASDFLRQATPQEMAFWQQHYTKGDILAYALDPERAEPLIGKQITASQIGGAAATNGFNITQQTAEGLANVGINQSQAQHGFAQLGMEAPTINKLQQIYGGQNLTTQDLINATFKGDASTELAEKKLASQERATFEGTSGIRSESLNPGGFAD